MATVADTGLREEVVASLRALADRIERREVIPLALTKSNGSAHPWRVMALSFMEPSEEGFSR